MRWLVDNMASELESAIPRLGRRLPAAVLVREFPTGSFDAHARLVDGGVLILINSGLIHFFIKAVGIMLPLMKTVHYRATAATRDLKPMALSQK